MIIANLNLQYALFCPYYDDEEIVEHCVETIINSMQQDGLFTPVTDESLKMSRK